MGLLVLLILGGCSSKEPIKVTTEVKDEVKGEVQVKKQTPEEIEDNYIKTTIESAEKIKEQSLELKKLLSELDIHDKEWQNDVSYAFVMIDSATLDYKESLLNFSEEQRKKYEKTNKYFDEGVIYFNTITKNGLRAVETYDKEALKKIPVQLDAATPYIFEAMKQLEIERYEE